MAEHGGFSATRRTENYHVGLVDFFVAAFVVEVVFHSFVMIVRGNRQNFFRALLLDDKFVQISFDDVRLIFFEKFAESVFEISFTLGRDGTGFFAVFVFGDVFVKLFDTIFADGKTGVRIENRHIDLRVNRNASSAQTATKSSHCH